MERLRRLLFVALGIVALTAVLAPIGPAANAFAQDDDQPADPTPADGEEGGEDGSDAGEGEMDGEAAAAEERAAIAQLATQFRNAFAAGNADQAYDLLHDDARAGLLEDLNAIHQALQRLPEAQRNRPLDDGTNPAELLALTDERAFFRYLMSQVPAETRALAGQLEVVDANITLLTETSAAIAWTAVASESEGEGGDDDAAADERALQYVAEDMPARVQKNDDGAWRIMIAGS